MDTQNTPVHVHLWHRGFWLLALANLLVTLTVYMMIPLLPSWMLGGGADNFTVAVAMGIFGLGLFVLGPFCSYLVQRYRRNHVCRIAIEVMVICYAVLYLLSRPSASAWMPASSIWMSVTLLRLLLGASFGLAQMVLCSTLIIDASESFRRTEANHAAAWFGRFALSLGPLVAIILHRMLPIDAVLLVMAVVAVVGVILIRFVGFPFKAPEDNLHVASLDRFWLPEGWLLFINLMLTTVVVGMFLAVVLPLSFYVTMMGGFLLALLAERFVFPDADLKSEAVTGLILIGASLLIIQFSIPPSHFPPAGYEGEAFSHVVESGLLFGFGTGIIGSRFLLFFIKLSQHCRRGTSQSTYFLSWESGVAMGVFISLLIMGHSQTPLTVICQTGVAITAVSLLLYNFVTHPWYVSHKNR